VIIRYLGLVDYEATVKTMQDFTLTRTALTPDELWLLEHPSVFTLGLAGKPEHLLHPTLIPVVKTDRGGQITYHGPGQLIAYLLLDIKRYGMGVRELVRKLEQAVIDLLQEEYNIKAHGSIEAPGVYVAGAKIAALGLRIRNGCSYHGLSFNVNMDLTPFNWINPCGYPNLAVTQLKELGVEVTPAQLQNSLAYFLQKQLPLLTAEVVP
jgi:lipoyl(octanoyl) transferase